MIIEYKVQELTYIEESLVSLEDKLNTLGKDGWKLDIFIVAKYPEVKHAAIFSRNK